MVSLKRFLIAALGLASIAGVSGATVTLDDPSDFRLDGWNSAYHVLTRTSDAPDGFRDSLRFQVNYSKDRDVFQFARYGLQFRIPGDLKKLSFYYRTPNPGFTWTLNFAGRGNKSEYKTADGGKKKMELNLESSAEWKKVEFVPPADWGPRITLRELVAQNIGKTDSREDAVLEIAGLTAEIDVDKISPKSVFASFFDSGRFGSLFHRDEPVVYTLKVLNWSKADAEGDLEIKVIDSENRTVWEKHEKLTVRPGKNLFDYPIPESARKFGSFKVEYKFTVNGTESKGMRRFATIQHVTPLTPEVQARSPWAFNVHGAYEGVNMDIFEQVGITWVRDFGFSYGWVTGTRDKKNKERLDNYAAWPWYPGVETRILSTRMMIVPCFMGSLSNAAANRETTTPEAWADEMVKFAQSYPNFHAWELDNEYNLRNDIEGDFYGDYHQAYAKAMKKAGVKGLIAEQGRAGINVKDVAKNVQSGKFADIDVINAHFYCGIRPPEISRYDMNAHGDFVASKNFALLFDELRGLSRAARSDGKDRQVWITEFGWDTLAGHVVSEREQAGYMQRCYILGRLAGIDKMFWFFNYDSPNPKTFFDGCGIFDHLIQPKPVAAAMSYMFNLLPDPTVLGTFHPAPNAQGYVVENDGVLHALVSLRDPDFPAPELELGYANMTDCYGNPLKPGTYKMGSEPIWIHDLDFDDPWVRQAQFELDGKYMDTVAAGDSHKTTLRFTNRTEGRNWFMRMLGFDNEFDECQYELILPPGVTSDQPSGILRAAPGESVTADIPYTITDTADSALTKFTVKVTQNGEEKLIPYEVYITKTASLKVEPFDGEPGKEVEVKFQLRNNTVKERDFTLRPKLPASWKADPAIIRLDNVQPQQAVESSFKLLWNTDYKADESASLQVINDANEVISEELLIPPALSIPQVSGVKFDADLSDWPQSAKLPEWAIGCTRSDVKPEAYLGYGDEGLYYAFVIPDSKVLQTDPTYFWRQDTIEFFIDLKNEKSKRDSYALTDHQFWSVPMTDKGSVYLGQWANGEMEATVYDIANPGASRKLDQGGYVIEGLIPAEKLRGAKLEKGMTIGLNFNITVYGLTEDYEVFWKNPKRFQPQKNQQFWGTVELK